MDACQSPHTIMEKFIHDFLTCDICQEEMMETRVLPCQHFFCLLCIQNIAKGKTRFPCPKCRAIVHLPKEGAKALPVHIMTERAKEFLKEFGHDATGPLQCDFHPEEKLNIFCKDDNSLLCGLCLVTGHNGHNVVVLKDEAEEKRKLLEKLIEDVDLLQRQTDEEDKLTRLEGLILKAKRNQKATIQARAAMLKKAIDECCEELCGDVDNIHSENLHHIQRSKSIIAQYKEEARKTREDAQTLLNQESDGLLIIQASSLGDSNLCLKPRAEIFIPSMTDRITLPETCESSAIGNLFGHLTTEKMEICNLETMSQEDQDGYPEDSDPEPDEIVVITDHEEEEEEDEEDEEEEEWERMLRSSVPNLHPSQK